MWLDSAPIAKNHLTHKMSNDSFGLTKNRGEVIIDVCKVGECISMKNIDKKKLVIILSVVVLLTATAISYA